jgi:hypothetical protein
VLYLIFIYFLSLNSPPQTIGRCCGRGGGGGGAGGGPGGGGGGRGRLGDVILDVDVGGRRQRTREAAGGG